jgi:hypothetical protein
MSSGCANLFLLPYMDILVFNCYDGYRRIDEKRNKDIRQNLKKILNLGEKVKEYQ